MPEPPPDDGAAPQPTLAERLIQSLPGLAGFVRRRMGPELAARESASDIVQSTYRELLRGAARFEDRGEAAFQRWIRSTAEHKLQNRARHWRAARRQGEAGSLDAPDAAQPRREPSAPPSAHPSHEAMLREEVERLRRAFEAVPPEQRRLLVRSQIDGASHAELARETGRTPEAVRKAVARAMARLAAGLEEPADQREESARTGRTPVE